MPLLLKFFPPPSKIELVWGKDGYWCINPVEGERRDVHLGVIRYRTDGVKLYLTGPDRSKPECSLGRPPDGALQGPASSVCRNWYGIFLGDKDIAEYVGMLMTKSAELGIPLQKPAESAEECVQKAYQKFFDSPNFLYV